MTNSICIVAVLILITSALSLIHYYDMLSDYIFDDFSSVSLVGYTSSAVVFTLVSSAERMDSAIAEQMLQIVKDKHDSRVVIITKVMPANEFSAWLRERIQKGDAPHDVKCGPVVFARDSEERIVIPSIVSLSSYLEERYPGFSLVGLVSGKIDPCEQDSTDSIQDRQVVTDENPHLSEKSVSQSYPYRHILNMLQAFETLKTNNIVTSFRLNPVKSVTNYAPFRVRLLDRGWKFMAKAPNVAGLIIVQDQRTAQRMINKYNNAMVNNIGWGGQACFGGTKGAQRRCRTRFAEKHGCMLSDLGIQPSHFNLYDPEECRVFFDQQCQLEPNRLWIKKPNGGFHGHGMSVHQGCEELRSNYGACSSDAERSFIMPYINPALIGGHKFDVRSYLLIARTDPLIAFYHDGFARKATSPYNSDLGDKNAHITNADTQGSEDHFYDFQRLQDVLWRESKFPEDYMENTFRNHAFKVQNFVLQAAREDIRKTPGTFQLFALDWIIDAQGLIHLLECNSNPLVKDYEEMKEIFVETWDGLMELVVATQRSPSELGTVGDLVTKPQRFVWRDWHLIFNELEEKVNGEKYNACNISYASAPVGIVSDGNITIPTTFEETAHDDEEENLKMDTEWNSTDTNDDDLSLS